jgi:hypothetical protein
MTTAGEEEGNQLVVHDLDQLLPGQNGAEGFPAHGLLSDGLDELLGDLVMDVGFKEGQADFPDGVGDIGLREPSITGYSSESAL